MNELIVFFFVLFCLFFIFEAKTSNILWFQLVKYQDLMHIFVLGDRKLNISEFWTVSHFEHAI